MISVQESVLDGGTGPERQLEKCRIGVSKENSSPWGARILPN
jgi:hypothetical protein